MVQECHLWLSLAERSNVDSVLSRHSRLPGWTVRRHCRGLCPAVLGSTKQTKAIQHIFPRCDAPSATAPPQSKPQSARRRGRPPVSSRTARSHAESSPRPAHRASREIAAPPAPLKTSVAIRETLVLREAIAVLLVKDAIELVPPAEMRQGIYSPYFIIPKKALYGKWASGSSTVSSRASV